MFTFPPRMYVNTAWISFTGADMILLLNFMDLAILFSSRSAQDLRAVMGAVSKCFVCLR